MGVEVALVQWAPMVEILTLVVKVGVAATADNIGITTAAITQLIMQAAVVAAPTQLVEMLLVRVD
jgi:hypothetical protein